ncbi:Maturase MatK, N-terminal domain-containing protein, partial [Cynara cardunculus var. scolymus]
MVIFKSPQVGFEPTTNRLTADRSTTELLRNNGRFDRFPMLIGRGHQLRIGCNNPNDPTTSGPFRRCTKAITLRSASTKKATPNRSGRIIPKLLCTFSIFYSLMIGHRLFFFLYTSHVCEYESGFIFLRNQSSHLRSTSSGALLERIYFYGKMEHLAEVFARAFQANLWLFKDPFMHYVSSPGCLFSCPWIQQQFERLTYSGISGSMLIFNSPKHFVAYYALPRLWVPSIIVEILDYCGSTLNRNIQNHYGDIVCKMENENGVDGGARLVVLERWVE